MTLDYIINIQWWKTPWGREVSCSGVGLSTWHVGTNYCKMWTIAIEMFGRAFAPSNIRWAPPSCIKSILKNNYGMSTVSGTKKYGTWKLWRFKINKCFSILDRLSYDLIELDEFLMPSLGILIQQFTLIPLYSIFLFVFMKALKTLSEYLDQPS